MWRLVLAAAIVALFAALATFRYTSQPGFCAGCHEMKPEFVTWSLSAHNKVACVDCHIGPGIKDFVLHKVSALNQVYLHITGRVELPIQMPTKIPNGNCLRCHSPQRIATPPGDLVVPHRQHLAGFNPGGAPVTAVIEAAGRQTVDGKGSGTLCVDCHARVAHAGLNEKIPGEHLSWKSDEFSAFLQDLKHVRPEEFRTEMDTCLGCHLGQAGPVKCEACHQEIKTPESHRTARWQAGHGDTAQRDLATCVRCHDIAQGARSGEGPVLAADVRQNTFCARCHSQRPPSHQGDWVLLHAGAGRADPEGCLVCHRRDEGEPGLALAAADGNPGPVVFCQQCHASKHPRDWRGAHPETVRSAGTDTCFTCHEARNCYDCHAASRG